MNRLLAAVALCAVLAGPSRAASSYSVTTSTDPTVSTTTLKLVGRFNMPNLAGVPQLVVDSVKGLFTWNYGIQTSTLSATATGNTTYSITSSSGISVAAGGVTAPFFSATTGFFGTLFGNAATATLATTATNIVGGASGSVPYQTGSGATTMLAKSVNGYAMQLAAGIPSWVAAVSSATNVAGGAVGSLIYQSAANISAFLAAGTGNQALVMNPGATAPAWTSGFADSIKVSTANISPGLNGASNLVQLGADGKLTALDGSNLTGIAGVLAGGTNGFSSRWTSANSQTAGSLADNGTGITLPATSSFTIAAGSTVTLAMPFTVSASTIVLGAVPYLSGQWSVIGSSFMVGGSTAVFFSNFISTSAEYRISIFAIPTAAADYTLVFNFDTGANWTGQIQGGVLGVPLIEAPTKAFLDGQTGSDTWNTGDPCWAEGTFAVMPSNLTKAIFNFESAYYNSARASNETWRGAYTYTGAANIYSVGILASAGNTGAGSWIVLEGRRR